MNPDKKLIWSIKGTSSYYQFSVQLIPPYFVATLYLGPNIEGMVDISLPFKVHSNKENRSDLARFSTLTLTLFEKVRDDQQIWGLVHCTKIHFLDQI